MKCSRLGKQVQDALAEYSDFPVTVLPKDNLTGAKEADVVVLDCKPHRLKEVLVVPGMRDALQGKLLISIVAGVPAEQIEDTLYPDEPYSAGNRCRVVRAMPNTAATVRESMTVIEKPVPPLPADREELVTWIFNQIGHVVYLPSSNMDASTALAGSGPAFMALALEGIADGAVAMGIPRAEAQVMAAQVMRGTSAMVQNGQHPSRIREDESAPGGCTIGGLLVLEDNAVRGHMARSVREATSLAGRLREGDTNVNSP